MPLLNRRDGAVRRAPVFSSMQHATAFLSRAEQLGYHVKLDYIFPVDGRRLSEDFPGYEFNLDPPAEVYFQPQPAS
jgi:hypothetical protein